MLFVSRLSVDRCTLSKMDADAVDLGLSPPIPKSKTRHDDKMILKIGHAIANELDTYFPLFSAKRIKGYSTKDKLISQLNQSMADDVRPSTLQMQHLLHGKFWLSADGWG